ncbi:hypothetical protein [Lignipirellula cremea]|uniref:Uncharacterized protein n=1 Tax=Lignipirellula cremea TaxID=2528010 RepID=A0A518DVM5_9BACT|nr:hypothetical protein [Lignipirellula cremea]QDU95892.1 hypothetical protein Pla8534_37110 [Lignipirellula cremea]
MVRSLLVLVSFCLLTVGFCRQASAEIIGIGLDWRKNIFVQEYWSEGKPYYAIANKTDSDQTIVCVAYRGQAKLAGPWKAPANSVVHVDASPLIGKDLVQFDLEGGSSLGLMAAPPAPGDIPQAPVVSFDGLNGSGGRHTDIWVEQNATTFTSGKPVELRMQIPGTQGELMVKKGDLPAIEVVCDTLKVTPGKNGGFTLDFAKPTKAQDVHTVVLKFVAPTVKSPTMLTVDNWLWAQGKRGGHGITRGVVVEPAGK